MNFFLSDSLCQMDKLFFAYRVSMNFFFENFENEIISAKKQQHFFQLFSRSKDLKSGEISE